MTEIASFKIFLALWNRAQGQGTPALHFRMAQWLEDAWTRSERRLLLQAFRSSGKSTIAGLFAAWLLYRDPDLRILVLGADLMLARKMVRNVKKIIERHPLAVHLKPARADQWGAEQFTVARNAEMRDPSMLAKGITTNITGSHADVIICDDVEVPNTSDTAQKRADLRERLAEVDFVLAPGGTIIYVGTPHTWHTIYADEARAESGEAQAFLDGFARLKLPVHDESGASAWPEKFSESDIERIKRVTGPNKFASQMMLVPVNIAEGRLDAAALRFTGGKLEYSKELDRLYLNGKQMVACGAWWDPSKGKDGGDASVFAVVFVDGEGERYLHRVEYLVTNPFSADDVATQHCQQVAFAAQMSRVPSITVEMNGIGGFLPDFLRREIAKKRFSCTVREEHASRSKDLRIIEAFDALLAARMLHVHESVLKTPFITEMQEWRPGISGQRDDGIDAVAGALSLLPTHLSYERFSGGQRPGWHRGGRQHKAKTVMDD